jgi:YegS/Rv2252/BmrU family lipid kinase
MTEILLLANPECNHGRSRDRVSRVNDLLHDRGILFELRITGSAEEVEEEARNAAHRRIPLVVVCGGDGTVHYAVNGLAGTDTVMAILPCGRGNDLARVLGIPKDPVEAIDVALRGVTRPIALGRAGNRYFVTVATLGFDSAVAAEAARPHPGIPMRLDYIYSLLRSLIRYQCPKVRLSGDFGSYEGKVFLCATGNTSHYGGGMKILPDARPEIASLEICLIKALPRLKAAILFPTVFRGTHIRFREVEIFSTKSVDISSDYPLPIYADGEPVGETPIRLEIVPDSLKVRIPSE